MPKKPHKRRSIAASRAASLKGWRTRKQMKSNRELVKQFFDRITATIDHIPTATIDRIPKVEWK